MVTTAEGLKTVPSSFRLFEDKDFRNWANEVRLVIPVVDAKKIQLIVDEGTKLDPTEKKIRDRFNDEPGQILPIGEFIELPSEIEDPILYEHRLSVYINRLRGKLKNPREITRIKYLGSGIGIQEYGLTAEPTRVAYCLKDNFDQWVSNNELTFRLDINSLYLSSLVFRFNNSRLERTRVVIERTGSNGKRTDSRFTKLTWAN